MTTVLEHIVRKAQKRAQEKKIEFSLDIRKLRIPKKCPYLGIDLVPETGLPDSPTLDRINSEKGYTLDNVIICSLRANVIKNDASSAELLRIGKNLRRITKLKRSK